MLYLNLSTYSNNFFQEKINNIPNCKQFSFIKSHIQMIYFQIYFKLVMSEEGSRRSRYKNIPEETRLELIRRFSEDGENIKDLARELDLNISTCKAILKVYQKEGRVGKKKKRNQVVNVIETYSFYSIDGMKLQQIGPLKLNEEKISVQKTEDLDQVIAQKTKVKANSLLVQTIQMKKKVDQVLKQQQLMQNMAQMMVMYPQIRFY